MMHSKVKIMSAYLTGLGAALEIGVMGHLVNAC